MAATSGTSSRANKQKRICDKCGKEDNFFHSGECRRARTCSFIEQAGGAISDYSWREPFGMDETSLIWCERCFESLKQIPDLLGDIIPASIEEKELVFKGILSVVSVSNNILAPPQENFSKCCSICQQERDACQQSSRDEFQVLTKEITDRIDTQIDDKLKTIKYVSHFGVRAVQALFDQFKEIPPEDILTQISANQLALFLIGIYQGEQVNLMIAGADAALGW